MLTKRALWGVAMLGLAVSANATIVSTSSLQNGLDAITDGNFLDVNTHQHFPDEVWSMTGTGFSANRLLFEFASFEDRNTFGIYDVTNSDVRLEIFDGAACGTAEGVGVTGTCTPGGNGVIIEWDGTNTFSVAFGGSAATVVFGSSEFGYYLDSSADKRGGVFFSESWRNTDVADVDHDKTTDHMLAFAGNGSLKMDALGTGTPNIVFGAGEFILAWEDLSFPNSDYDYSDMVILVESVIPVPEPPILVLLGLGLLGIGYASRRRQVN